MLGIFKKLMNALSCDIGIDLGTANTLVFIKGQGVVIREPSVVAMQQGTKKILAVGAEAKRMLGRTPGNIVAVRPMKSGVIADFDITEAMIRYFIAKARGHKLVKPRVVVAVPSEITEVEWRAVEEASKHAGARDVTLDGLVRCISGDTRVFERRLEGKAVNTAIHLLIDDSGSMLGERMLGAQIAAISLMKVLAGLKGINLGVSVFPGHSSLRSVCVLPHAEGFRGGKIEEAVQNVSKIYPWGGTPMLEALLDVTKELKRCTRCTRHILYILTDGEVNTVVAPLLSRIKAAGIETRALLIAGKSCGFDVEVHLKKNAEADKIAASLIEMVTADVVA